MIAVSAAMALLMPAASTSAATRIGFGVGAPLALPVDWSSSVSFIDVELFSDWNLSVFTQIGTYPASFPNLFEIDAALLAKSWMGPLELSVGGGLSLQLEQFGGAWLRRPLMNVTAGVRFWPIDTVAISLRCRSLEALPISWTFTPEVSLGIGIGIGRRPPYARADWDWFWLLVGLCVAGLIAYCPRT